jgi:hypothetical protein
MFAETERLRIRGYRESDLDRLVAIFSDPRKRRGDPEAVVPESETKWRIALPAIVAKRLMFCILRRKKAMTGPDTCLSGRKAPQRTGR